jgi:hypothetical protein
MELSGKIPIMISVKRTAALICAGLFLLTGPPAYSYKILYAEQFYRLFHLHYYQYPERTAENISYLERALRSDFANPLYALARIPDAKHWERYVIFSRCT